MPILNIAAYRFVALDDPAAWVAPLRQRCEGLELKGTIIVATEGINLSLAGELDAVEAFVDWLAEEPLFVAADGSRALVDLPVKRSSSPARPFRRLRVKCRREIVTMRRSEVRPTEGRAPGIAPAVLARWLDRGRDDDGRPVTLLDTRNALEVAHGTFRGARHLDLERFDAFPDAIEALRDELRDKTVVTFCTGGIRCEKAALLMRDRGFRRVLQLDGGILDYFDRVGAAHWAGTCFVFDDRVSLGSDLAVAGASG